MGIKRITSIVRKTKYEGVSAYIEGLTKVKRNVLVFENRTDKEVDVYVELGGNYSDYYIKAYTLVEGVGEVDLESAVYTIVKAEMSSKLDKTPQFQELICAKRLID